MCSILEVIEEIKFFEVTNFTIEDMRRIVKEEEKNYGYVNRSGIKNWRDFLVRIFILNRRKYGYLKHKEAEVVMAGYEECLKCNNKMYCRSNVVINNFMESLLR